MKEDLHYIPGGDACFTVELAGKSWCDGNYRIERQHAEIWVMEQILEGRGTILVDGEYYQAAAGDVYLLPAGSSHCYYADPAAPWVKLFMNIRGTLPEALFGVYGLGRQVVYPKSGTEALFQKFYQEICQGGSGPEILEHAALRLHQICIALHAHRKESLPPEAEMMREYLEKNLHRLVSVAELAGVIYRSPDYANRLFRDTYGVTPYAFLLRKKMELACRLLESSTLPVQEIAARLGYHDPQYFSGLFHKMQGVPPSYWRQGRRPSLLPQQSEKCEQPPI